MQFWAVNSVLNFKIIFKIISILLAIITLALLSCEGLAVAYHEALMPFLYSAVITAVLGVLFWTFFRHNHHNLDMHRKDAYFTVVFSWFIMGWWEHCRIFFHTLFPCLSMLSLSRCRDLLPQVLLFWPILKRCQDPSCFGVVLPIGLAVSVSLCWLLLFYLHWK